MTRRADLNVGDVLLRWLSERERGTWNELRDGASGLLATVGSNEPALLLALRMSALGHLDLDWRTRTWSVAPPVLVIGRHMGLCAYIAGWRTAFMQDRFAEVCDDLDCYTFNVTQDGAPTAMFAKVRDVGVAEHIASRLAVRLVWDAASQLASVVRLPALVDLPAGAGPMVDDELRRFNIATGLFDPISRADDDGLYQFPRYGSTEYRLATAGDWRIVNRAEGLAHVLRGRQILGWSKASPDGRTARAMTVPRWFTLPTIAERAAVAATGLLPIDLGSRRAYRNVGREVATTIATALGLGLEIKDRPLQGGKGAA
jgi:hypothetical protein